VDDTHDGPYAREPQIEDLVRICRALNEARARYILIGGFAVIAHGGARTTKDIDLLVDASSDNVSRVKQALRILEDRAIDQVADTDVARYTVVRVADEIVLPSSNAKRRPTERFEHPGIPNVLESSKASMQPVLMFECLRV
jgi:hypothetical protein